MSNSGHSFAHWITTLCGMQVGSSMDADGNEIITDVKEAEI